MSGYNKAIVMGNVGKIEVRHTEKGTVANISVATNESWKDANGERQEHTEWHNVVVWGKLAEVCEKYVQKGKQVLVEGVLRTRSYQDKAGAQRTVTEIKANNIQFTGTRQDSDTDDLESY